MLGQLSRRCPRRPRNAGSIVPLYDDESRRQQRTSAARTSVSSIFHVRVMGLRTGYDSPEDEEDHDTRDDRDWNGNLEILHIPSLRRRTAVSTALLRALRQGTYLGRVEYAAGLALAGFARAAVTARRAVHERRLQHDALVRRLGVLARYLTALVVALRTRLRQTHRCTDSLALLCSGQLARLEPREYVYHSLLSDVQTPLAQASPSEPQLCPFGDVKSSGQSADEPVHISAWSHDASLAGRQT